MKNINRRKFLTFVGMASASVMVLPRLALSEVEKAVLNESDLSELQLREKFMSVTEKEWKKRLTPEEFDVLREDGTERAGSSPLNDEKRGGMFVCAGCQNPLFKSETKYESGTGWPSFYDYIPGSIETKPDRKLFVTRTEYHCARCGGHQGHVFEDGPEPTGLRYCNNGVALNFIPNE